MKTVLLTLLLSLSFATQAQAAAQIMGWDSALPQAEQSVIHQIQTYAIENYYTEVEQGSCGGDTAGFELSNYYTFESFNGELIHKIKVKVFVSGSYKHCQGEVISECEAPVTLYSANHISMGQWRCTVVQLP